MKKISAFFIICFIILSFCPFAQANSPVISRLIGLGIMAGDEIGEFNANVIVTRAEFAVMAAKLLQVENVSSGLHNVFSDVPPEHLAYNAIGMMHSMGIINGRRGNLFEPDEGVTFNEATKMLICILGYNNDIMAASEYPQGYLAMATNIGLFKGVRAVNGEITRLTAAELINAALDIVPLTTQFGKDGYVKGNATLYDYLIGENNIIKIRGIVTATGNLTVQNKFDAKLKKGYAKIDDIDNKPQFGVYGGLTYKVMTDYSDHLGMFAEGYARYDATEDIYIIVNLEPTRNNEIIAVNAQDVLIYDGHMEYIGMDDMVSRKLEFADDITFVYNGRVVLNPNMDDFNIYYGGYRALDNTGDGLIDILLVDEMESLVVERTHSDDYAAAIHFANKRTYRGSNQFDFDFDDKDKIYDIMDEKGNALSFEDIQPGQGITFAESLDGNYTKIVLCNNTVSGTVDGFNYNDNNSISGIIIDGAEYKMALGRDGKSVTDVRLKDEGVFVFDIFGNIIDYWGYKALSFEYAYVVSAAYTRGLDKTLKLRLVQGAPPIIEETVIGGNIEYTYYFQNNMIEIYECDAKAKVKAQITNGEIVPFDEFDVLSTFEELTLSDPTRLNDKLIGFSKGIDGKIREIYVFDLPKDGRKLGSATFNNNNPSFGGEGVVSALRRGFLMTPQTAYICVPNNVRGVDDDFYIRVTVEHNSGGHNVYGGRIFFSPVREDLSSADKRDLLYSQPVDFIVLKKPMDSINLDTVSENANICMVANKSEVIVDSGINAGEAVVKLELLNGSNVIYEYTIGSGEAHNAALELLPGDLVRYNNDAFGRIAQIERVGRIQGLDDNYKVSSNEIYGLAENIEYNVFMAYESTTINTTDNIIVDNLTLDCGFDGKANLHIPVKNGPPVYIYERSYSGWILPAGTEKIRTINQNGAATRIYTYVNANNVIKAIVIIK